MPPFTITASHLKLLKTALIIEALHIAIILAIPIFGLFGLYFAEPEYRDGYVLIMTLSVPLMLLVVILVMLFLINLKNYKRFKHNAVDRIRAENIFTNHLLYGILISIFAALFFIGIPYIMSSVKGKKALGK
ncbi:MAG: hypothetical protein ACLFUQ_07250, partial [Candidatus Izemoplasmataceae bacterium]